MTRRKPRAVLMAGILVFGVSRAASPCTLMGSPRPDPIGMAQRMVAHADWIVRVKAVDYTVAPDARWRTTGTPDSRVRFTIVETLKGPSTARELVLPGYLSDTDDFNDRPVPYDFVRPEGRAGSCFANTYRTGAEFLLLLKDVKGTMTEQWEGLGPVNEQLRGQDDLWLGWVRDRLSRDRQATSTLSPETLADSYAVYSAVLAGMHAGNVGLVAALPTTFGVLARTVTPRDRLEWDRLARIWPDAPDLVAAATAANRADEPIERRLLVGSDLSIVAVGDFNRFSDAPLVGMSAVGFSTDGTEAMVYVYFGAKRDVGDGFFARLHKRGAGWAITSTSHVWTASARH